MYLLKNVLHNQKRQDILIVDNLISQIADSIVAPNARIINCQDKAIFPSFCNGHTHASMMFLRGVGENKELLPWLQEDIWPREAKLSSEAVYHLSRFAILEMIKTGTTCFMDMYFYEDQTINATYDMGIRGAIAFHCMDFFDGKKTAQQQEQMVNFLSSDVPSDRIIKGLSCHSIYTTSKTLFQEARQLTNKKQTFLHTHLSETQEEINNCIDKHKCRPVELLHKENILNPQTIIAHAIYLNDYELDLLIQNRCTIAHCPTSNLKLNSGQMQLQHYLDRGAHVMLGTDGVSSNNSLSMLAEMKIASLSAKNIGNNSVHGKTHDIIDLATKNGFETLGLNAGKIEPGALADFILIDLKNPLTMPHDHLESHLVYSLDSSAICDVFCDGKPVMRDKVIPNEQEIIREFQNTCKILSR